MKIGNIYLRIGDNVSVKDNLNNYLVIGIVHENTLKLENHLGAITYVNKDDIIKVKRPTEFYTIYEKKEILDEEEKEYLSAVIRPFRDKIVYIQKQNIGEDLERINIRHRQQSWTMLMFPFTAGTMYKNMVLGKQYTLEELGL